MQPSFQVISVGDPAPIFVAGATNNKTVDLNKLLGNKIVLYFYPKDNTPGCTHESKSFAKKHPEFFSLNAVIIGISKDSIQSHEKFKMKYSLPFDIISDSGGAICQQYGVLKDKMFFGRKYKGIERSTFLIDQKGIIQSIWRKVKIFGHVREVLESVKQLKE